MIIIGSYIAYILVSLGFTIWVGQNLFKNGKIFLLESFENDKVKADSVNHLLLVGFYLVNVGIVCLFLNMGKTPTNEIEVFEYLATKFGVVLVILGGMHFYNMRNIANMSARARAKINKQVA